MYSMLKGKFIPSLSLGVQVQVRIQRGTGGLDSLNNHKNIGFLSNSGPDSLKNQKATKPAFNVGSSSARQRNAI